MTKEKYLENQRVRQLSLPAFRKLCSACRKPHAICQCSRLLPFESMPEFAILIHRTETKRSIATGRLSHLALINSYLIEGTDFTENETVNRLIEDPTKYPMVLYPTENAVNLTMLDLAARQSLIPAGRTPLVFVIDATWSHAKRMKRLSRNFSSLPFICFTPPSFSHFMVRRQPKPHCYSTIESIHHVIDLFGGTPDGVHHQLRDLLDGLVNRQIELGHFSGKARRSKRARGLLSPLRK